MAPRIKPGMDPIQERDQKMRAAIDALVELFPGATLSLFVINIVADGPLLSHISNVDPRQVVPAIKAWAAYQEGQLDG